MEFNDNTQLVLEDIESLLNIALNRVYSCTGFTDAEARILTKVLSDAKQDVATATEYLPKNY